MDKLKQYLPPNVKHHQQGSKVNKSSTQPGFLRADSILNVVENKKSTGFMRIVNRQLSIRFLLQDPNGPTKGNTTTHCGVNNSDPYLYNYV